MVDKDVETPRNFETPNSMRIFEIAADISPCLERYNAGIFGGVAIHSYSAAFRPVHDIDILCPRETIIELSRKIADRLNTNDVKLSPVGFDIGYIEGHTLLDLELMACDQTENGLHLPFNIVTPLPLQYEWRVVEGKRVLLVSKELLCEMKSKSTRDKDKKDLWALST